MPRSSVPAATPAGADVAVSVVTSDSWEALADLFGRSGASNGCWCQYWLLGPEYHRRDRVLNRHALAEEIGRTAAPGPGLLARSSNGAAVGWARLTPRSELPWLLARFGRHVPGVVARDPLDGDPVDDKVWSMPCFFVGMRWRDRGVMSALISAGIDLAVQHRLSALEAYPVDPAARSATRNRFTGVLQPFLEAGFTEVARISADRAVVRYEPERSDSAVPPRSIVAPDRSRP